MSNTEEMLQRLFEQAVWEGYHNSALRDSRNKTEAVLSGVAETFVKRANAHFLSETLRLIKEVRVLNSPTVRVDELRTALKKLYGDTK